MKVSFTDMNPNSALQTTRALTLTTSKRTYYALAMWQFDYPKAWAFGLVVSIRQGDGRRGGGQKMVGIGWGWAEGETMSPFPRYQWMPNKRDGKTATWFGFFCQHTSPFEFVPLNP
jgi:hypothetical protein